MPESGVNDNFWNSLLTAGMSMYASGKKKKEENKQLDWMNSILADKQRYEDEKVARYKSSPAAQMSPMIMEMLVNAYGPKFKKYGIDMPIEKMLSAINGGSQGPSSASNGPSGGGVQQRTLSQIANGEEPRPMAPTGGGTRWMGGPNPKGYKYGQNVLTPELVNNARKTGDFRLVGGKVDPEIEGYNGKTWDSGLEVSKSLGMGLDWGTPATALSGPRENTRKSYGSGEWVNKDGKKGYVGTGATGAYLGYTPSVTNVTQWKDPSISKGNFEGDGGGWDDSKPTPEQIIGGEASGPLDDKVGFLEWLQSAKNKHPVLWGIGKAVGNLLVPGLPNLASGAIDPLVARGFGDGQSGNAGITRVGNRKRGGQWGAK